MKRDFETRLDDKLAAKLVSLCSHCGFPLLTSELDLGRCRGKEACGWRANTTNDGVPVEVGQRWRNLDKREQGRGAKRVIFVGDGRAFFDGYPKRSVAIRRMHRHSTGWELVR